MSDNKPTGNKGGNNKPQQKGNHERLWSNKDHKGQVGGGSGRPRTNKPQKPKK